MKIKNNIYHVIFFDVFFVAICLFIVAMGFFLGFELSPKNITIYLSINGIIVLLGVIVFIGYILLCKSYYEFTSKSIKIVKNKGIIKEIGYNQIHFCKYCSFYELLLGDPSGGRLIIYYNENGAEQCM